MGTLYWKGTAPAVAQAGTVQVTGYDAGTTYMITVGDLVLSTIAQGGVNQTATALAAAWNTSTSPYCTGVTAVANTDTVTFTADTAGVPFTLASSKSGATGTIGAYTPTVACSGPNHWDTALNWSTGAVPVDDDDVVIKDSSVNICWGLAQSAVILTSLTIHKSYTGKIGLNRVVFATSSDGETTSTSRLEYRDCYLAIGTDYLTIGENLSPSTPAGSSRILINLGGTVASVTRIKGTAATPSESGRPAIRLLDSNAGSKIFIENAPGGVGIAVDAPGEVAETGDINICDTSSSSKVYVGAGVTVGNVYQDGGIMMLQAAAEITTVNVSGGTMTIYGNFSIATFNLYGGVVNDNHIYSATGISVSALCIWDGEYNCQGSNEARSISGVTFYPGGGKFIANGAFVTVSSLTPPSIAYQLSCSS